MQDVANRRIVIGNELNMEEDALDDFKKLCEGAALNVRVKHQPDKVVFKTPVLIMANSTLDICRDPAFVNVRFKLFNWNYAAFLKDAEKKAYPLAIFDVLNYYDIKM